MKEKLRKPQALDTFFIFIFISFVLIVHIVLNLFLLIIGSSLCLQPGHRMSAVDIEVMSTLLIISRGNDVKSE
jgi:hypothetical protein